MRQLFAFILGSIVVGCGSGSPPLVQAPPAAATHAVHPALAESPAASWFLSGGAGSQFAAERDTDVKHATGASMRLHPKADYQQGYGTLMRSVAAGSHRGKK